jgi:hypothetical protein
MKIDETLSRFHDLTSRLQEGLAESADIRARIANARQANRWPDLRQTSRPVDDVPELPYFRAPHDDRQTH